MKRSAFIIIGVVLVLVLIAIWIYVLFVGSPENGGTFADFNFGDTSDPTYIPPEDDPVMDQPVVDVTAPERLRQLTTEPTIGYQEVRMSTSSDTLVYYAQAGTGHVYSINLSTGEERRISGTTIPTSQAAAFTPDGRYVMIQSGQGANSSLEVAELDGSDTNPTFTTIDEQVVSFNGVVGDEFLYAVRTVNTTIGKRYNPETNTSEDLFTVPFREAIIVWAETVDGAHYVYPKATSRLEGFLFEVVDGELERLPIDGYGLSAVGNDGYIVYSRLVDSEYKTFTYEKGTGLTTEASLVQIPEKCTVSINSDSILCANTLTDYDRNMPDTWYMGEVGFTDGIWEVYPNTQSATLLIESFSETGRELDMMGLNLSPDEANLYFLNKNDRTLWLFERFVVRDTPPPAGAEETPTDTSDVTDTQ